MTNLMRMSLMAWAMVVASDLWAHDRARTPIRIPDLPDGLTLKCDFHIHTVFSDGKVWPDIRAEEAWREGLDAIAITDHIEHQPHKQDLPTAHNRSYQIARAHGEALQLIVIRGSEITRSMPPGHLNAIFLKDATRLDVPDWREALAEALRQGAFIFWNHPGWRGQQADGQARWYPEHDELLKRGQLHGIEVVNEREYYPEAHLWCLEKNLTMLSNSDIHNPIGLDYDMHAGERRPLNLVFARERSADAIRQALFERRTVVFAAGRLIGRKEFLEPLFERSVRVLTPSVRVRGTGRAYVQIQNDSDITYVFRPELKDPDLIFPEEVRLPAGRVGLLEVRGRNKQTRGTRLVRLAGAVMNLWIRPQTPLPTEMRFEVILMPEDNP
ncbi:MAG: Sb-PDE family phosphodiesterase [Verrucomicrobiota bacterium]|nr:Sb-PDE family phosphodiesterase [Limisphaera sp.]MDW8381550.1 Sb-PDE family phosphodiesterase [Verrucomicrobiota bacterium]